MLDRLFEKLKIIIPAKWHWILEHGGFKKYFANTGWMFLGQIFSLLVAFFISAWLARYFGPENYGIFSYAIAFAGMFSFIANLGVDRILARELVDKPEEREKLLGTGFILKIIGGITAFLLVVVISVLFIKDNFVRNLIILYSFVFIAEPLNIISVFFQSQVKAKINTQIRLIVLFIISALKITLILSGKGIIWLTVIFVLDTFLSGVLCVYFYKKSGFKITEWNFDKKILKIIITGSLYLMLASAANYIFIRVDQVMIGSLLTQKDVGFYAAAVKIMEVWYFIPVIICGSLFPAIMNAKKSGEEVYLKRLKMFMLLLCGIGFLIAVPTYLFSSFIIKIIFGIEYVDSISILQIYAWSGVGLFLGWGIYHYLLSENKLKSIFYFYLFSMILNVVLNYFLIINFGLNGAAWATLISYSIGPLVFFITSKKIIFFKSV